MGSVCQGPVPGVDQWFQGIHHEIEIRSALTQPRLYGFNRILFQATLAGMVDSHDDYAMSAAASQLCHPEFSEPGAEALPLAPIRFWPSLRYKTG